MVNVNDLIITSLDTISAFGVGDHADEYLFTLDELQNASIGQGQEKTDLTGKAGRKLASLKRNKTITVSGTNGMLSGGMLELQTGGTFVTNSTDTINFRQRDYFTISTSGTYKLTGTPITASSNSLVSVYTRNSNGTLTELTKSTASEVPAGSYKLVAPVSPATEYSLVFNSGLANGTEIVAIYDRHVAGAKLDNPSDKFSGKAQLYIDATAEDKCSHIFHVQIWIPKADLNGEFTIEMGDNQAVHNFEAEGLAGACGAGETLWTFTVVGENAADV